MAAKVDITVHIEASDSEERLSWIKLQGREWELNVNLNSEELSRLSQVKSARWDRRQALKLGEVSGSSAYWCSDQAGFSILVGHDDETWDFGVTISNDVLDGILAEVAAVHREQKRRP